MATEFVAAGEAVVARAASLVFAHKKSPVVACGGFFIEGEILNLPQPLFVKEGSQFLPL